MFLLRDITFHWYAEKNYYITGSILKSKFLITFPHGV